MFFKHIKKLVQKNPFIPGDRVKCPCCGTIFALVKAADYIKPGIVASVQVDAGKQKLDELEQRVKQLECVHEFVFDGSRERGLGSHIRFKCNLCGKIKKKYWYWLPKKEQQAYKLLKLVPEYWEVNGKVGG